MNAPYDESFWVDFAKELSVLRAKEDGKLPYNFNLIDELGKRATENANTRILLKLLNYRRNGEFIYLKSFLEMMLSKKPGLDFPMDKVIRPSIDFNREYIDGLIEEQSGDYAVIIENKINWAVDQNCQIERYYNTVRSHGVDESHIYVIYLTSDGNKEVSTNSLPEYLKESLGDRFIEMDYRHDILPWLKDDILPEVKIKEVLIESGIRQYIDYLAGQLGLRESEKPLKNAMNRAINEKLGLDGKNLSEKWKLLDSSMNDVANLLQSLQNMKADIAASVLQEWDAITRQYFDKVYNPYNGGYYQIFLEGITDSVHFEWYPFGEKELFDNSNGVYRLVLHVENDRDGRWMSLLYRNAPFGRLARSLGYDLTFRGVDAICKEYTTPAARPFAALGSEERRSFLASVYSEVKELKACAENTIHKFDGEQDFIVNLCKEMTALTGQEWWWWPKNPQSAWDIGTKFNPNTHEIGIEGGFNIRESDAMLVFNSYVTVWDSRQWSIYEDKLNTEFPGMFVDKSAEGGRRVYLHLPEVVIGEDLGMWDERKHDVVAGLSDTFSRMKRITSEVGL